MARIWIEDLRYHRACGFFNERLPADYRRLERTGQEYANRISRMADNVRSAPSRPAPVISAKKL